MLFFFDSRQRNQLYILVHYEIQKRSTNRQKIVYPCMRLALAENINTEILSQIYYDVSS